MVTYHDRIRKQITGEKKHIQVLSHEKCKKKPGESRGNYPWNWKTKTKKRGENPHENRWI